MKIQTLENTPHSNFSLPNAGPLKENSSKAHQTDFNSSEEAALTPYYRSEI